MTTGGWKADVTSQKATDRPQARTQPEHLFYQRARQVWASLSHQARFDIPTISGGTHNTHPSWRANEMVPENVDHHVGQGGAEGISRQVAEERFRDVAIRPTKAAPILAGVRRGHVRNHPKAWLGATSWNDSRLPACQNSGLEQQPP